MKRIYDFSSFLRLYEADTQEGEGKISDFQNLIQMTLANILDCYNKQTVITKNPYDPKIMGDYDSIASTPGVDSLKKILGNVKTAAADDAKDTADSLTKAGESFLEVLSKIYEIMPNYKGNIDKIVSDYLKKAKENLIKSAKESQAKEIQIKESTSGKYRFVFEDNLDFLKGKKRKIKDISKQITLVNSVLRDLGEIDFLKGEAAKYKAELDKISGEVGEKFGMKNTDIKEEDIEKISSKMSEITSNLSNRQKEIVSQNETTRGVTPLFIEAIQVFNAAINKYFSYLKKSSEEVKPSTGKKSYGKE